MALVDVDIEDYLDEVSTSNLIKELEIRKRRGNLSKENGKIIDLFEVDIPAWPPIKSVLDQQKQDWVIENWERITP